MLKYGELRGVFIIDVFMMPSLHGRKLLLFQQNVHARQEHFRSILQINRETYFSGIGIGNGMTLLMPRASLIFGVPRRSTSSMRTIECIGTKLRTTPSN